MSLHLMKRIGRTMKNWIYSVLLALILFACSPLSQEQEAQSAVGITSPDGYAVACVTGFTRVLPHVCNFSSGAGIPSQTSVPDGLCRSFDLSTTDLPTSARAIRGYLRIVVTSTNAIGARGVTFGPFVDSGCTLASHTFYNQIREFAAVAADTMLLEVYIPFDYLPLNGDRVLTYTATTTGGASSKAYLSVFGYYD